MNKIIIIVLLNTFIFGCSDNFFIEDVAHTTRRGGPEGVDPEIAVYYHRFNSTYEVNAFSIPASFNILREGLAGVCYISSSGRRWIEISQTFWEKSSDNAKEQLIYHELGHCLWNLGHNENTINLNNYGEIPESIMFPVVFGGKEYYETFKNYYFKELKP